jgi:hypothetical protein
MTQLSSRSSTVPPRRGARGTSGWVGWVAFAGVMMTILGVFHIVQGLVALLKDEYLAPSSVLLVDVGYTAWGWAHLVTGAVVLVAGFMVFAGQVWARAVGTVVAGVSAVGSLAFLTAYPVWSVLVIALDVVVIMALTVHGSEIKAGG